MIPLFPGETEHAWHRYGTQAFPPLAEEGTLCLIPVAAYKEYKEDLPLDTEERLCGEILNRSLSKPGCDLSCVVMPPVRQVPLQAVDQVFTIGMETASELVEAQLASAVRSGFTRFCFLHVGEELTDWLDGLGRDVRVTTGARVYRIGLHLLGLNPGTPVQPEQVERLTGILAEISRVGETS